MIKLGKTVTLISERDFSELVSKTYHRPYRLQQQGDMMGQDTIHEFSLPLEYEFEDEWWDADGPSLLEWCTTPIGEFEYNWQADLHWERNFYPDFDEVITDLYARGLIPAGDYAIHASW